MTYVKFPPWCSTGDKSLEYDSTKTALGFVEAEPPAYRKWNARKFLEGSKINEAGSLAASHGTAPPYAGIEDICSGFIWSEWVSPSSDKNLIDVGDTIIASCMGRKQSDPDQISPYIMLDTGAIHEITGAWDYDTDLAQGSALSLTYPTTPDSYYGMASDAGCLYVVWSTTTGDFQVTKFSLIDFTGTAVWTADTGMTSVTESFYDIIIASFSQVSVATSSTVSGSTPFEIHVINKTTAAVTSGRGSYDSELLWLSHEHNRTIVTDGYHIFWIQYIVDTPNAEYDFYLCSAKLSDPTTSDYARILIGTHLTADEEDHPKSIARVHDMIVTHNHTGVVWGIHPDTPNSFSMFSIQEYAATDAANDADVILGFDGLNLWASAVSTSYIDAADFPCLTMFKVPGGAINQLANPSSTVDLYASRVRFDTGYYDDTNKMGKLLFDGIDMWLVTRPGVVYRISNPGGR